MIIKKAVAFLGLFMVIGIALIGLDRLALSRESINFLFLAVSILGYAVVGLVCRTTNMDQYYVADRSVSAGYNGLATAADWLSAASVIGLTGLLLSNGFVGTEYETGGLVYIMGWTGGFCLLAFWFAAPIRQSEAITIPDFLAKRHDSHWVRWIAAIGTLACSIVYLIAQIYGIGLVTSMLSGLTFELGVLLALGGVLLCSFLGGMRAVTWTQVIQAFVIVFSMLGLVMAVSWKTNGSLIFPLAADQSLAHLEVLTQRHVTQEDEVSTRQFMMQRVERLQSLLSHPVESYEEERRSASIRLEFLRAINAPLRDIHRLENSPYLSKNGYAEVIRSWTEELHILEQQLNQPTAFTILEPPRNTNLSHSIGLFFCLALGTVSLPHLLIRSGTTVNSRAARHSMVWTLLIVAFVYVCASSMAVIMKDTLLTDLIGRSFSALPSWMDQLRSSGRALVQLTDWNNDGWVQLGDVRIINDHLILAIPEILGISPIFTGLIAAGALAAALSTADGLLLTISNALVHDMYFQTFHPNTNSLRKVMVGKIVLMIVALTVAWITTHRPVDILYWVACAFSLASSTIFPALFLSVHWKRVTTSGLIAAMTCGMLAAVLYIGMNQPQVGKALGLAPGELRIWNIEPIAAGVLGVPIGFIFGILISYLSSFWNLGNKQAKAL